MKILGVFAVPLLLAASAVAQYEGYGWEHIPHYPEPKPHHEVSHHEYEVDYHAHPKYAFDYSVKDPHTGDNKEHWETRDGDKVKGTYTVIETDGTKRVVEYEADDKNGFNAVVHKIGVPKEHHEIIKGKPLFEPLHFHHEPQDLHHFDDGFVPVPGGFEH